MKNKRLLPILLSALFLVGCTTTGTSSSEPLPPSQSGEQQNYAVAIANKDELAEAWYTDSNQRSLTVTLTPEANALAELTAGNLTVSSSDPTVVSVTGLAINPLKAGEATITVSYHGVTDTVKVTVIDGSAKARYGTAHEGTAEDPFTNEDALLVAKHEKYEGQTFYVKGKVESFYNSPGSRTDGMVAFYLEPATAGGEKFEIYKCFKEDGSGLTDDDIWVGGEVTAYGAFTKYNSQYETSSAVFVKCDGTKPAPRQTLEKSFDEALAAGVALGDGASSYDYYKFSAYVSLKDGNNYYVTKAKGEELTKGKSDAAHGERDIYTNAIELYSAASFADSLLKNAQIEVTMELKNYHGTVENNGNIKEIKVLKAGEPWVINYQEKTVAEALAVINALEDGKTADGYFAVTGRIVAITTEFSAQYKNISFTIGDKADDANLLTCFRVAADEELAAKLVAGAKVIVKGQLQKYVKDGAVTPELISGKAEVVDESAPTFKALAVIDAANLLGYAGENVAYAVDAKPVTISGLKITSAGCGCYGDGIQMRTHATTGTSTIYNTEAVEFDKLQLVWAASKNVSDKEYHVFVEFSNSADFATLVGEKQNVKFDAGTKLAEAVPTAAATFFRITHANQGAVYMDQVKVLVEDDGAAAPEKSVRVSESVLSLEENKVYVKVSGTAANYAAGEFKWAWGIKVNGDNGAFVNGKATPDAADYKAETLGADGAFTVKFCLSDIENLKSGDFYRIYGGTPESYSDIAFTDSQTAAKDADRNYYLRNDQNGSLVFDMLPPVALTKASVVNVTADDIPTGSSATATGAYLKFGGANAKNLTADDIAGWRTGGKLKAMFQRVIQNDVATGFDMHSIADTEMFWKVEGDEVYFYLYIGFMKDKEGWQTHFDMLGGNEWANCNMGVVLTGDVEYTIDGKIYTVFADASKGANAGDYYGCLGVHVAAD